MKVGIVGLGKMGLLHTGILNTIPDIQIVSMAEKDSIVRKHIAKAIPNVKVYDDYNEMLAKDKADVIFITTPSNTHLPIMSSCIKNNINFFVEKPMTKDLTDAKQVCSELKNSNIINSVGYNGRFIATFSKAKSLLDSNILSEILNVKSSMFVSRIFSKPSGWRYKKKISGGGVLLEFGCHLIDILLWYFGKIDKVEGNTRRVYSEVEDFANMKMQFENNISGELETSWSVPGYRMPEINVEITGTNGTMRVNEDFIDVKLKKISSDFPNSEFRVYKQELESGIPFDVGGIEFTKEDLQLIECIKNKKEPLVNVFEASKTQSVIQSMYDADSKKKSQMVEYID